MLEILFRGSVELRKYVTLGSLLVVFQWWFVPTMDAAFTGKWLWSLYPAGALPVWFRVSVPLILLLFPWTSALGLLKPGRARWSHPLVVGLGLSAAGGLLFWVFRVGPLVLGDSRLIADHFISLSVYASVREPLESVLHTEFSRLLFFGWGIHPMTGFRLLSCLWGALTLGLAFYGLHRLGCGRGTTLVGIGALFLVTPIHLFFGYVEWYTQMTAGLIVFQIYALLYWKRGEGLWMALAGLVFACGSHLVSFAFVPAAVVLIGLVGPSRGRTLKLAGFGVFLAAGVGISMFLVKRHIAFDASVEATSNLFYTLLPFMREDNPNNPPGSWTYAWLSQNHLSDLANQILLCAYFPGVLLLATLSSNKKSGDENPRAEPEPFSQATCNGGNRRPIRLFFAAQLLACGAFLLIWNPWLGFPADWDLFSFFSWPLLALSLFTFYSKSPLRVGREAFAAAAVPALSLMMAWVIHYHGGLPDPLPSWPRSKGPAAFEQTLEQARFDCHLGNWPEAFGRVEKAMSEDPQRIPEAIAVFGPSTLQTMSQEWPSQDKLIPLAVDFEIMAASPYQRLLVLDRWGRVFFWEGGYFNDWSPAGLPGIPDLAAVDMEIVPWRQALVVLREDGEMYEVPIGSWVEMNPQKPRETHYVQAPVDRSPKPIGNFYSDLAEVPLGRGQRAVALALDYWNQRMIVLDTAGRIVTDKGGTAFGTEARPTALIRIDAEANYNGELVFLTDCFGDVTAWPGKGVAVGGLPDYGWPAVTDTEIGRGGVDFYLLDGQGGVSNYSAIGKTVIDPAKMRHFAPTGEPLSATPYSTEPFVLFIDLELIPFEKAYYRMTQNFRIHYSEDPSPKED